MAKLDFDLLPPGQTFVIVKSERDPTKEYRVSLKYLTCSCPAYVYHKLGGHWCKHLGDLGYSRAVVQRIHDKLKAQRKVKRLPMTDKLMKEYADLL